jgi:hypothetical protein
VVDDEGALAAGAGDVPARDDLRWLPDGWAFDSPGLPPVEGDEVGGVVPPGGSGGDVSPVSAPTGGSTDTPRGGDHDVEVGPVLDARVRVTSGGAEPLVVAVDPDGRLVVARMGDFRWRLSVEETARIAGGLLPSLPQLPGGDWPEALVGHLPETVPELTAADVRAAAVAGGVTPRDINEVMDRLYRDAYQVGVMHGRGAGRLEAAAWDGRSQPGVYQLLKAAGYPMAPTAEATVAMLLNELQASQSSFRAVEKALSGSNRDLLQERRARAEAESALMQYGEVMAKWREAGTWVPSPAEWNEMIRDTERRAVDRLRREVDAEMAKAGFGRTAGDPDSVQGTVRWLLARLAAPRERRHVVVAEELAERVAELESEQNDLAAYLAEHYPAEAAKANEAERAAVDLAMELLAFQRGELEARPAPIVTSLSEAVAEDLESLGEPKTRAARSMRQLATYLAEVMDKRGADAGPTTAARLAQELRATMRSLTVGDDEGSASTQALQAALAQLSTPAKGVSDG